MIRYLYEKTAYIITYVNVFQMLLEMLMTALLTPVRQQLLPQLKGPTSVKIALWYKVSHDSKQRKHKMLSPLSTPCYLFFLNLRQSSLVCHLNVSIAQNTN